MKLLELAQLIILQLCKNFFISQKQISEHGN